MILDYLAPGARRRTHTAGTTEAGLLGLLDVKKHAAKVQKRRWEVNRALQPSVPIKGICNEVL
jgi:hypothetical protein